MSSQDNSTDNSLTDAAHVTAADGGAAVASPASLTLADLNTTLGKDFKDLPSALKALKDTQSYVGKKKEDIVAEALQELTVRANPTTQPATGDGASKADIQSLKDELFYTQNPQYKDYRGLISKMGQNPAEIVDSPEFKGVYDKAKAADDEAQKRSVVSSSSRVAQDTSVLESAVTIANARGSSIDDVALALASSINKQLLP